MKSLIIDVAGLAGFGALVGGVYLKFGAAVALMAGGSRPAVVGITGGQENKNAD